VPTVLRASLTAILPLIETQVVAVTGLSSSQVYSTAQKNPPIYEGDHVVQIRPTGFTVQTDQSFPEGRLDTRITRDLAVKVVTRLGLDEPDRDRVWLEDQTLGHIVLEESVINALQNFWPTDVNGNVLTTNPIQLAPASDPETEEDEPGWGSSLVTFQVSYILPLNQGLTRL
jgi:hypothetical protein